jgi:hypothetical protein
MRRAARTDANHRAIVKAAEQAGLRVYDTSMVGNGFPDLVAQYGSVTELWEVKNGAKPPSKRRYTPAQEKSRTSGLMARLVLTEADVMQARSTMVADMTAINKSRLLAK